MKLYDGQTMSNWGFFIFILLTWSLAAWLLYGTYMLAMFYIK